MYIFKLIMNPNDYLAAVIDTAKISIEDEGHDKTYRPHLFWRFNLIKSDHFNIHVLKIQKFLNILDQIDHNIDKTIAPELKKYLYGLVQSYILSIDAHNSQDDGKLSQRLLTEVKELKYSMLGPGEKRGGYNIFSKQNEQQDQQQQQQQGQQQQQQ